MSRSADWSELLRGGLLPRFALLLLGVWLNAADTLVTVTVMPSVARAIGGYAYFGWAAAVFLLGAITAGASSGLLGARIGLRAAMAGAGLIYSVGCVLSALSPDIGLFLAARLAQGLGAGWIVGLVFVAVGSVFPPAQWARAMAATTSVWGVATLLGPMVGGLFAAAGPEGWRGVFWFFAVQGLAFSAAAWRLLPRAPPKPDARPDVAGRGGALPWRQLALLVLGVMAVASAGLIGHPWTAAGLTLGGMALLVAMIRLDATAPTAMLPRATRNLRSGAGAGYLTIFLLEGATAGWSVYGTALIQTLYAVNPLVAGYVVGCVAVGWTLAALPISGLAPPWHGPLIRGGAGLIVLGLLGMALTTGRAPLLAVAASAVVLGAGFGLSWSFMGRRILASLPEGERGLGAAAIPTVQMIGAAVGAAGASALGDGLGLAGGMSRAAALHAAPYLFAVFLPLAALGWLTADRLARLQPTDSVAKA
jgi:MFS family permease